MCTTCNFEYWIDELYHLLNDEDFQWAFETLDGIHS